jgi:peptidoglycan/xylan/chitin deacetylase (PgdA/CDA1 family)
MWDVDTIDWLPVADGGPTANQIVQKVVNNAKGGSIVLMHLGGYNTFQALPAIVAGLQARGLAPATIGQLIAQ